MDPFESLDEIAAKHKDPVLSAAVAEVNACYGQLRGQLLRKNSGECSELIFDRLQKASAVAREKLAELDAKRDAATGLDDAAIKEMRAQRVESQLADFKAKQKEIAVLASQGDETAEFLVQMKAEVEAANGGKKVEELFKKFFT